MSLENKGRIRILRGNASNENVKTVSLYDGQPFYDTNSKHLYIGDGTHTIENTAPIIADANNIILLCNTAGDKSQKTINLPGYKPIEGQRTFIKFTQQNTQNLITLNINESGESEVYYNNSITGSSRIKANIIYELTYEKDSNLAPTKPAFFINDITALESLELTKYYKKIDFTGSLTNTKNIFQDGVYNIIVCNKETVYSTTPITYNFGLFNTWGDKDYAICIDEQKNILQLKLDNSLNKGTLSMVYLSITQNSDTNKIELTTNNSLKLNEGSYILYKKINSFSSLDWDVEE